MRELSDDEIAGYLECGEWRGKAGGYAIQGVAAAFVAKVSGSVTNVSWTSTGRSARRDRGVWWAGRSFRRRRGSLVEPSS